MNLLVWKNNRPRRSFECSHFSTFHRTRGPCSTRTGRYHHRACTRTCADAIGAALTHKRSWTEIFMSHSHHHRDTDFLPTFPLALRPVSQTVTPFCLSRSLRSDDSTEPGWKVMLAAMVEDDEVLTDCTILTSACSNFQTLLGRRRAADHCHGSEQWISSHKCMPATDRAEPAGGRQSFMHRSVKSEAYLPRLSPELTGFTAHHRTALNPQTVGENLEDKREIYCLFNM